MCPKCNHQYQVYVHYAQNIIEGCPTEGSLGTLLDSVDAPCYIRDVFILGACIDQDFLFDQVCANRYELVVHLGDPDEESSRGVNLLGLGECGIDICYLPSNDTMYHDELDADADES